MGILLLIKDQDQTSETIAKTFIDIIDLFTY